MESIEIGGELFYIDALREDNLSDLIPLYRQVFGVHHTLKSLKKKYNTDYLGVSYFGHFARDEHREAVAFHGAIPYRVVYGERQELAAQYGDAMTLKKYTGRGFFTLLGKRTDELLKSKGVRFVYGFPNQNSEYGYLNKMNWSNKVRMNCYKFRVVTLPLEVISRKWSFLEKFYKNWALRKLDKHKSSSRLLPNSATTEGRLSTCRDEGYFEYKSFTNNAFYDLKHGTVWLKLDAGLLVGDMCCREGSTVPQLLKELMKLCRKLGVVSIVCQWYPNSAIDKTFRAVQAPEKSWVVGYCNFNSEFPVEDITLTYGDLDTF